MQQELSGWMQPDLHNESKVDAIRLPDATRLSDATGFSNATGLSGGDSRSQLNRGAEENEMPPACPVVIHVHS